MMRSMMQVRLLAATLAAAALSGWSGAAFACETDEPEPNDTPDTAATLASGECFAGNLAGQDQDAFVPTLPGGTGRLVTSAGGAGLLKADLFSLERNEEGGITRADKVATIATPLGGGEADVPVSLAEGEYIIGLSRAGGSVDYTIALQEADVPEDAVLIEQGKGDKRGDGIAWDLREADADKLWRIRFNGSSTTDTTLVLREKESGQVVRRETDAWGRVDLSPYGLDPGAYSFFIDARDEAPWQLSVTPVGKRRPEREREPNDKSATAQPLDGTGFLQGRLSDGHDTDHYFLTLEDNERRGLRLRGLGLDKLELCVRSEGGEAECREARRRIEFEALESASGVPLLVSVAHEGSGPLDYQISMSAPHGAALRALGEPNSSRADAPLLPASGKAEGLLVGTEYDSFLLETDAQATWRINVTASGNLSYLTYDGGRYGKLTSEGRGRQATLDSLVLPAGRHLFTMRGARGDGEGRYYIEATRLGGISNNRELEPNNSRRTATPMAPGDRRSGNLASGDGSDGFLISPETATPMRVTLDVGEAAGLEYEVSPVTGGAFDKNVDAGGTYVMERVFEAGESMINLRRRSENASYTLSLEELDRAEFASRTDQEPNNTPETAGDLPIDGRMTGDFDDFGEWARYYGPYDIYRLPDEWAARSLILTGEAGGAKFEIVNSANDAVLDLSVAENRSGEGSGKLPDEVPLYLRIINGDGPYRLAVWPAGETPPDPSTAELSARLELDDGPLPLAAHWPAPQPVPGTLVLENTGDEAVTAQLDMRASLIGTQLRPDMRELEVPAGETRTVAFEAAFPANLPTRRTLTIIADVTGAGRTATQIEVPVEAGRTPERIAPQRGIPDSMFGGVNVAAASAGGTMLAAQTAKEKEREDLHHLIDGMVGRDSLFDAWIGGSTREPVVAVGFASAPITGIVLYPHPDQARRYPASGPSHAVVEARTGGKWTEAWRGRIATGLDEIILPFEGPVDADAVRVRMRNYGAEILKLSELKVIASPDHDPTGGEGYDIADFARGGEMLGGVPKLRAGTSIITRTDDKTALFRGWSEPAPEFTTAFRFHRSAEITRLEWTPAEATSARRPAIDTLNVLASADTTAGPWEDVGSLSQAEPALVLDAPVRARYLRFIAEPGETDVEAARDVRIASDIRVQERAPGNGYTSVLGFYGHAQPRDVPEVPSTRSTANRGSALKLEMPASGVVERGATAPEYEIQVPAETNRIVLSFDPSHRIVPQVHLDPGRDGGKLLSAPGPQRAEALRAELDIPEGHSLRIIEAEPGKHRLRFSEPRRSLLVTWDTSGSIGSFRPAILRSLDMISAEIDPEMDAIGLLPFGSSTLLGGEWHTDREKVRTLLRSVSEHSSSNATDSIKTGLGMLNTRPGARAMLIVTDMEDPSIDYNDRKPYDLLNATGSLLFAGQVNGGGLSSGQSLFFQRRRLRGLTHASDGSFSELVNPTQIVDLFDTAMGRLRGPKPYRVTAYAYDQAPPPPGRLAVTLASGEQDEGNVIKLNPVEIVLDASGSMLQRLPDGRRRITAAKQSIRELVESGLPGETPAALRVFGHLEPDSCDTRLVRPLAPISEGGFVEKLEEIQARNLAKTPIADSLRLISKDLEDAAGDPLVVLLTDGDETCEGDPAAVLEELQADGMEIRVNIVGFAVGAELDKTFSNWARAGNGEYFKADDAGSLGTALETAVRPQFEVLDSNGETVATATTGADPIELPVGRYNLVFSGGQTRTADIISEDTTTVEISVTP